MVNKIQSIQGMGGGPLVPYRGNALGSAGFREELRRQAGAANSKTGLSAVSGPVPERAGCGLIHVGTISRENPTVSHLLISHPEYGRDCWEIIHSGVNGQKAFRRLQQGEEIYIDPGTFEIVWEGGAATALGGASRGPVPSVVSGHGVHSGEHKNSSAEKSGKVSTVIPNSGFDSGSLPKILRQYIGTPYERLDCYELVVKGLKEMGVRYSGKGGLQDHLIHAAEEQGLPMNAYLTGNGLIDASSSMVYDRTVRETKNTDRRVEQLWKDLASCLEQGLIISFSTGGRGHTGVLSRYGETWTLLNSGDIDNDVRSAGRKKGVGEEDLRSEIANWLRRAERGGEALRITVGRLNREKLSSFLGAPSYERSA